MPTIRGRAGSAGAAGLTEALEATARLYDDVAHELDLAAQHSRTAATHFRNKEIPRGAAREHARRSVPQV